MIVGGSVGGLFAALLLRQTGWQVDVYERTIGDLGDRGTGIGTRPELFAAMRRAGIAVDASTGTDVKGRLHLGLDGGIQKELLVPGVTSAWSRVWRPLRRALPDASYQSGKTLAHIDRRDRSVVAHFTDGTQAEGDLLIAADGVRSTVRQQLLPNVAPRYAGYVAWRGVVSPSELPPALHAMMFHHMVFGFPDGELMLSIPMPALDASAGERCCHFVWFRPLTEEKLAEHCTDASGRSHALAIPPHLIRTELIEALRRDAARSLAPQLAALVSATPQIILQPIFDLESPQIAFGRVALVGDAAFVARPHVASGVMKAAIDAQCLAECLAGETDIEAALTRYDAERQPYGAWLVQRGRHIGRYFAERGGDAGGRAESLMREYGAAGMVRDQGIVAHAPQRVSSA